jgi:hypothetical protein
MRSLVEVCSQQKALRRHCGQEAARFLLPAVANFGMFLTTF